MGKERGGNKAYFRHRLGCQSDKGNEIDQMGGPTASTFSESEKWTNAASLFDESTVAL